MALCSSCCTRFLPKLFPTRPSGIVQLVTVAPWAWTLFACAGACSCMHGCAPYTQAACHSVVSVLFQMYITSTIKTKSSRLAKPVLCLGTLCTAFLTGLNRVSEYRNHCSDVIAGFILGTAVALFLVGRLPSFYLFCLVPSERLSGITAGQIGQATV